MTAIIDATDRARRAEFLRDARAACQQRVSPEQRIKIREGKADEWAEWFRRKMDTGGADPVELLPDAFARLEQLSEDTHSPRSTRSRQQ